MKAKRAEPIQMTTWYQLKTWLDDEISPVQVQSSTDKTVVIDGRKRSIHNNYSSVFPTWEDAHAALLRDIEREIAILQRQLKDEERRLAKAKSMRNQ